jgi:hypothetical protein
MSSYGADEGGDGDGGGDVAAKVMVVVMARCDRCGCIGSDSAVGCGGCEVNTPGSITAVELGDPLLFLTTLICCWCAWPWRW